MGAGRGMRNWKKNGQGKATTWREKKKSADQHPVCEIPDSTGAGRPGGQSCGLTAHVAGQVESDQEGHYIHSYFLKLKT